MRTALVATCAALGLLGACSTTPPPAASTAPAAATAQRAVANLAAASGSLVSGRLTLTPIAGGVRIAGDIGGLAPGSSHGFHIHEKGDCSAADASSAGGHFNPGASAHGRAGTAPHHAGDIDNIRADADGVARVDVQVAGVALGGGGGNDIASRALVVHAVADDYASQPAGNAGARIACGVIAAVD